MTFARGGPFQTKDDRSARRERQSIAPIMAGISERGEPLLVDCLGFGEHVPFQIAAVALTGIVRVNSILPARPPRRAGAPLFLLTNCRRARSDSSPKIAYTYLP
jgi:hypothetical protein